jgi:hypothetical protein
VSARSPVTAQELLLKNARERMDLLAAYRGVGSYRGAAAICGTTHKTVRRVVERRNAGAVPERKSRDRNDDGDRALVAERVRASHGKISAKRLLSTARAAGYAGSARNFRRLVAGGQGGVAGRASPGASHVESRGVSVCLLSCLIRSGSGVVDLSHQLVGPDDLSHPRRD